jgi:hypothetical protein
MFYSLLHSRIVAINPLILILKLFLCKEYKKYLRKAIYILTKELRLYHKQY